MRMFRAAAFSLAIVATLPSCAGPVERWIVNTRVSQGDGALERGNLHEAELAYRLALSVDPKNARARRGFAQVSVDIADSDYHHENFDDALATLAGAAKYDPTSVRIQAIRSAIEQAKLKREIVISNYPTYGAAADELQKGYAALTDQNALILKSLKRFNYTFDTNDLTSAIQQSYEYQLDVSKNTNRLIAYRQLVESGVPESAKGLPNVAAPASLLPLP